MGPWQWKIESKNELEDVLHVSRITSNHASVLIDSPARREIDTRRVEASDDNVIR